MDDDGRNVILDHPAERIITLSPDATELLFSMGAGEKIVGTVRQSDYPEAAKKIKRIGQYPDPDLELMVQLKPDLIIMPQSGSSYGLYEKLKQMHFHIYIINPKKISDIAKEMISLGKLTGKEAIANQKAEDFLKRLNQFQYKKTATVFYELWDAPLMTISGDTILNEAIERCGGENIFEKVKIHYPKISKESVIQKNPNIIIVTEKRMINDWKNEPEINAVKQKKIYYLNADNIQRNSPRILSGLQELCQAIYYMNENDAASSHTTRGNHVV